MAQAAETRKRGKARESAMTQQQLLKAYGDMLLIRRFEEKAGQLYGMGLIGGFCHLYIGQEAVVVGIQAALGEGDQVITSYRDHGHMLATGMEPRGVMARAHRAQRRLLPRQGRLHAHVQQGAPLLRRPRHRRRPGQPRHRPCHGQLVPRQRPRLRHLFGEGASNQGQVFESLNLAALMKLPCIYVIENNKYGMGTSVERASASRDLSKNGAPLGHPRRPGGRHGRHRREGRRRPGRRPLPRRPRSLPHGSQDLPLPRPLHVRPGEIPHPRRSPEDAERARLHRGRAAYAGSVRRGRGRVSSASTTK